MKRVAIMGALVCGAVNSVAAVLWDSTSTWNSQTSRVSGGSMPAGHWLNTNAFAINLTRVAFMGNPGSDTDVKYVLGNASGAVLDVVTVFHVDAGLTTYAANVNWTIAAGDSFYIGSMHETGTSEYQYRTPVGTIQSGLEGLNNGNYTNYASPTFEGTALAEMTWLLEGSAVPEPATMAILGLGAVALLRRRTRRN